MRITIFFIALITLFTYISKKNDKKSFTKKFYDLYIVNTAKNYNIRENLASPLKIKNYKIKAGDSLWNIAKKFDVGIETIISFNQIKNVHLIPEKKQIKIPNQNGLFIIKEDNASLNKIINEYNANYRKINFFNVKPLNDGDGFFLNDVQLSFSQRLELLGAEFLKPLLAISVSSQYGFRIHPISKKRSFHHGVDFRGRIGDKIFAAKGGRVIFAGQVSGYGKVIYLKHNKGYQTIYAHLNKILVRNGQKVANQQVIGLLGNTGASTGPHLHFEVWQNGKIINPLGVLDIY